MPRFYFDVRNNGKKSSDANGEIHANAAAAKAELPKIIGELARDSINAFEPYSSQVILRDGSGARIASMLIDLTIDTLDQEAGLDSARLPRE